MIGSLFKADFANLRCCGSRHGLFVHVPLGVLDGCARVEDLNGERFESGNLNCLKNFPVPCDSLSKIPLKGQSSTFFPFKVDCSVQDAVSSQRWGALGGNLSHLSHWVGQSQVIRHGSVFSAIFDLASGKFCFWGSGVTSPILCSISSTMGLGTGVAFAPMWDRTCPYSRLWMLRCNIHFKQLQGALDPTL